MDRDLLPHIPVILAVARRSGFAAAASELGISASAVSHAVRLVEQRIGQPLFARTTRSVALTEAGRALVATAAPAIDDIADRIERLRAASGRPSGVLRINAPRVALPMALDAVIAAMAQRYPDVTIEVVADDGLSDIVAQGFDAGVRLGAMIAQDMIAIRLTPPFRAVMVASPAYTSRAGRPRTPADLAGHACIGYRLVQSGARYRWELQDAGQDIAIEVNGPVITSDALHARALALAGIGIAYLFAPLVAADLAAGRLIELLPDHAIEEPGLFLYFPRRASDAPKLRALIDTARELVALD